MAIKPVSGKIESQEINNNLSYLDSKSSNPLGTMQVKGDKIPLNMLANDVIQAMTGNTEITNASGYFENNRGVDYPLRNMMFEGGIEYISDAAKDAILDIKVFGARMGYYYRLLMLANGNESKGKQRWGITVEERTIENFSTTGGTRRILFNYNDDEMPGNEGNANWQKQSDGIETITIDNGEIAVSVTIDREVISNTSHGEFINLATAHAKTSIIDPSNYFF